MGVGTETGEIYLVSYEGCEYWFCQPSESSPLTLGKVGVFDNTQKG